ncbi:MFS transporter [Bradyrhizobium sp. 13971]
MPPTASVSAPASVAPDVPTLGAVQRWFVRRRGFASGLAVSGIGVGTLVMPPLATWLITSLGWRDAYVVLGVVAAVVGIGAIAADRGRSAPLRHRTGRRSARYGFGGAAPPGRLDPRCGADRPLRRALCRLPDPARSACSCPSCTSCPSLSIIRSRRRLPCCCSG